MSVITTLLRCGLIFSFILLGAAFVVPAQTAPNGEEFGPVVRAYLGYLRNEQEVTDDRASRHQVTPEYYRRNSNRIRALRQMAVRIADETQNDYLPELEAVAPDELRIIFEKPPRMQTIKVGQVVKTTFRYLGVVRNGETFYVFARLDPYEQADLMQRSNRPYDNANGATVANPAAGVKATTRTRRVNTP